MKNDEKTNVEPQIRFLSQILEIITKGELRVPRFQRPFIWKPDDIVSLFESISNGYPIGSLLFWKTTNNYQSLDFIGPYKIPLNKTNNINYILDGHQRLSALYGTLILDKLQDIDTLNWQWRLYYDLQNDIFLHVKDNNPKILYIPVSSLLKTIDLLKECKRIQDHFTGKSDIYIEKAENLSNIIRNYQIPITQIEGGNLDSAVEIFSRLNSKGRDITQDQMFSALTYNEISPFNLSIRINEISEQLTDYYFSGVERVFIFRSIIASSEKDIYKSNLEKLAKDKKININILTKDTEKSLLSAAKYLYEDLLIPGSNLLPYRLQLTFLSEFFRLDQSFDKNKLEIIKQWFWFTSYTGWFAGADNIKIKDGLNNFRNFANGHIKDLDLFDFKEKTKPFPKRFDLRNARVRCFVLFLMSLKPMDFEDYKEIDTITSLSIFGHKSLPYIDNNNNSPENRLLLGSTKYRYVLRSLQQNNIPINALNSHGITIESYNELKKNNIDEFFKLRKENLIKLEKEFIKSKNLIPYDENTNDEFIIDTE